MQGSAVLIRQMKKMADLLKEAIEAATNLIIMKDEMEQLEDQKAACQSSVFLEAVPVPNLVVQLTVHNINTKMAELREKASEQVVFIEVISRKVQSIPGPDVEQALLRHPDKLYILSESATIRASILHQWFTEVKDGLPREVGILKSNPFHSSSFTHYCNPDLVTILLNTSALL